MSVYDFDDFTWATWASRYVTVGTASETSLPVSYTFGDTSERYIKFFVSTSESDVLYATPNDYTPDDRWYPDGASNGTHTITGLSSGTKYYYRFLTWYTTNPKKVYAYPSAYTAGSFTTKATTPTYYSYYLKFDKNATDAVAGSTSVSLPGTTYCTFTNPLAPTLPTRDGYEFLGWGRTADATTPYYYNSDSVTLYYPNTTLVLYAVWAKKVTYTYEVIMYNNDGTSEYKRRWLANTTKTSHTFTLSSSYAASRDGYEWLGWADSPYATTAQYGDGSEITCTASNPTKVIYCVWRPISVRYYLYFYKNATDAVAGSEYIDVLGTTSGTFKPPLASSLPTRSGYEFLGWGLTADATTPYRYNSESVTLYYPNTTLDLYAVWAKKYTYIVLIYNNDGTSDYLPLDWSTTSTSYSFTLSSSYVPTRTGYEFLGWADSSTATTADYVVGDTIRCTSSNPTKVIYCVWKSLYVVYTITFYANGGTGAGTPRSTLPMTDTSHTFSALTSSEEPTREGYDFKGWDTSSAGTTVVYRTDDRVTAYSSNPDIKLYAVWAKRIRYRLFLDGNGGTLQGTLSYTQYNSDGYAQFGPPITQYEPIRTNYKFLGWSRNANATSATYNNSGTITLYPGDADETGEVNVTIYAIWKPPTTYQVIFNANGGIGGGEPLTDSTAEDRCEFGPLQSSEAPTREGYDFLGWSVVATATTPTYVIGDKVTVYESEPTITLYAIWKKIEYPNDTATLTIESPTPILLTLKLSNITARNYDRTIKVTCGSTLREETIKAGAVSFQKTFTDLTPGTSYATSAYIYAPDGRETWKEIRIGYTQFGFNWTNTIAQGQPVSNLTASDWNKYMGLLAEKAKRHDATSPKYTTVASEDPMTATICNQPTLALYYIYGYYPVSSVAKGYTIYASFFNDLKTYLNTDDN